MKTMKWVGLPTMGYELYSSPNGKSFTPISYSSMDSHADIAEAISKMYDSYAKHGYRIMVGDTILYPESKTNIDYIKKLLQQSYNRK